MAEIDNLSVDTERLAKEAADNTDNFCNDVQKGDVQHQENLRLKAHVILDLMLDNLHRSQVILKQELEG